MGKRLKSYEISWKTQEVAGDLAKTVGLSSYENGIGNLRSLLLTVLHGIIMLQSIILLEIAI